MKIEYILEEENFIDFHLFSISENKTTTKMMLISKLFLVGLFAFFAINLYNSGNVEFAVMLGVFVILALLFYNKFYRYKVRKHYSTIIKNSYSQRIGKKETIEFSSEYLITKDNTGEGKTKISEVEKIDEISNAFFIKLSNGSSFILPKKDIDDIELLKNKMQSLNFTISENLSWQWK